MIGTRIYLYEGNGIPDIGSYYQYNEIWFGVVPNGLIANLDNHVVVEHDDGTITVSPKLDIEIQTSLVSDIQIFESLEETVLHSIKQITLDELERMKQDTYTQ